MKRLVLISAMLWLVTPFALAKDINEKKLVRGDMMELDRAFVKLSKADGDVAEDLDIMIGKTITTNTLNFLRAYKKHKGTVKRLDALVGNFGPEYIDDFPRQSEEARKRIKALKAVHDQKLISLASECIKELERELGVADH